jgi:endonuclease/exonuclease/phosphatase family metal-dependent hydrolase
VEEIRAIRRYVATKPGRGIPRKRADRLLIATWNIANLGVQQRRSKDYRLIAEIISWFDLVAVQEVNDNLQGLEGVREWLPDRYRALYSDASGNRERMAFLYDSRKVGVQEEIGELAPPPKDSRSIRLREIRRAFEGFDRTPYLGTFRAGRLVFTLVNVHLYYGGASKQDLDRRALETLAVARWADIRRRSGYASTHDVICLGDFNLPRVSPGDRIYEALTRRGLRIPRHQTQIGTSISEDRHYDQIAFFPGETATEHTGEIGVVDFDGAVFHRLWESGTRKQFNAYVRYYLSDHRPLWAQAQRNPAARPTKDTD